MAATLPLATGDFATVVNPQAADMIDTLVVSLMNPAASCCVNPMGLIIVVIRAGRERRATRCWLSFPVTSFSFTERMNWFIPDHVSVSIGDQIGV